MSKVLVIDDEKSIRVTLGEFLKKEGFCVKLACDAQEASGILSSETDIDIVVTDIIMPKMSGIDMIQKIRDYSETVQIIVMTGEPTVDTAIKAVQNGAQNYMTKPIIREEFTRAVRHAAQVKRLIDDKAKLEKQNSLYQKTLEGMVEKKTEELQQAMQSIVSLLTAVVEARDPYTAGHQRRVGNLSMAIAQKMGLDENTMMHLLISGYIHDIGKIVIPTEILSKPGKLSALEMQMIQSHPEEGYEMLKKVEMTAIIGETIRQHHERCDGSGYPQALTSHEILIEAKILMVADVVEAMVSHRPYRPALGLEAALDEIKQNAGCLYCDDAAKAGIALFTEDAYVIEDIKHKTCFPL